MGQVMLFFFGVSMWLLGCRWITHSAEAQVIGVNYGLIGDDLPSPDKVIALYASRSITRLRLFNPNATVLEAIRGSAIEVILGTYNEELQRLGTDASYAADWVQTNVAPYASSVRFRYINAGNE
ncbi:Glycosyl hydrolases family 17, partial [Musa troglodytarum]